MSRQEAAYHHAGHAVATYVSEYHVLAAPLNVDSYGTGEVTAALSRRKLQASKKAADLSSRADPEVAGGIAVILCAGFASEKLAAARGLDVSVEPSKSAGDFETARQELRLAGLPDDTRAYEATAAVLLEKCWPFVEDVASALMAADRLEADDVHRLLSELR